MANLEDFTYMLKQIEPARVCFGSGKPRKTLLGILDALPPTKVGPGSYNIKLKSRKITSKKGTPGIANLAKRFTFPTIMDTPDPGKYSTVKPRSTVQSRAPFGSCVPRTMSFLKTPNNPGPQTYKIRGIKKCKRTRLDYNFGRPCVVPAVETICIPYPSNWCAKCHEPFDRGDFWHHYYQDYLCTLCMDEEHHLHEMYTEKELCAFKKIRTCSFMHRHEGTSAAIRTMPPNKLKKKLQIENYLSLYIQCYCSKSQTELNLPLNDQI